MAYELHLSHVQYIYRFILGLMNQKNHRFEGGLQDEGSELEWSPISSQLKRSFKRLPNKKQLHKSGRWNQDEDEAYLKFILANEEHLKTQEKRRKRQVFTKLSKILKYRRTPDQCRTHHNKMKRMTKRGTIQEIQAYLKEKYQKTLNTEKKKPMLTDLDYQPRQFYRIVSVKRTINQLTISIGVKSNQIIEE